MSEDNKQGFFSQIKNQIATGIGLVITAAFGILIANMQAIFEPKEDVVEQPIMEQRINPPAASKDTIVISKTIVIPPKKEEKEEEISW
jgi:hypothetical protein